MVKLQIGVKCFANFVQVWDKNKILKYLLSFTSLFRYQLRVRYFPKDLKELYTRDKVTFFYLFDQVKESLIF